MRRAQGLVEFSRRDFCAFAVGGLALLGCTDGGLEPIHTGALGGGDDQAPPVDAKGVGDGSPGTDSGILPDAGVSNPDASGTSGPVCTGSPIDVGLPSAFQTNTPVYFASGKFFVVKDAGGYYAVSSLCTHEGATNVVSSGRFRCPRHGALFQYDGSIVSGPVTKTLSHYSMCTMSNGHIGVTTAVKVVATVRYNP
jgi:nitrite reductase/ring-hydroxylating ferredoxin subunit